MAWRVARSLDVLLGQLNKAYPHRSTVSDGSIGDAAHATRTSDHNPWYVVDGVGVVTARDYTHDPAGGFDAHAFAEHLRQTRDPRIKYVISDRRIFSSQISPWTWRPYTGSNPHTKHIHLSVVPAPICDDTRPWAMPASTAGSRLPDLEDDAMSAADVDRLIAHIDARLGVNEKAPNVPRILLGPDGYYRIRNPLTGVEEPLTQALYTTYRYAVLGYLEANAAKKAAAGQTIDVAEVAAALAPILVEAVVAAVAEKVPALTVEQATAAAEDAVRRVLGSLNDQEETP